MLQVSLRHEDRPTWDTGKRSVIEPHRDRFNLVQGGPGEPLNGTWFVILVQGASAGYAWLVADPHDSTAVEVEVCCARPGLGAGSQALKLLEVEAQRLGFARAIGVVRLANPEHARVAKFLGRAGYVPQGGLTLAAVRTLGWVTITFEKSLLP